MIENRILFAAAVAALAAFGCAHNQQTKTQETPPAPMATPPPPAAKPVAEAPPPAEDLDGLIRATVIHFEFNQDVLTSESRDHLQKLAEAMRGHSGLHVKIAGNCDERGTEEYNIALGQRRAEVAKKYLAKLGVTSAQIDTVSYGKEKPADPGHSEEAWAQNRRDEFQPQ
jgi:peptidoglycan-associated lipoprotein